MKSPDIQESYIDCDMSKYIAYIIDTLNHDTSISDLLNPVERIQSAVARYHEEEPALVWADYHHVVVVDLQAFHMAQKSFDKLISRLYSAGPTESSYSPPSAFLPPVLKGSIRHMKTA